MENHHVKCDICSFVVEANNHLVDVCSQLVLIYAPLLACFESAADSQAIKQEAETEVEDNTGEAAVEGEKEDQALASESQSHALSNIFLEAYDVQCHVDGCILSVAYYTNNTGSDVESKERNHH